MPSHFTSSKDLRGKEIAKGVMMKPLAGRSVMLCYFELAPGSEIPTHSHPHEQAGMVIEGQLELWIGDERKILQPGDMYTCPGGVPHGGRVVDGPVIALDVFHPIREEYLKP